MAYVTGVANDLAALKNALVTACTANGYSWNSSTNVMSKTGRWGSGAGKDIYVEINTSGAFLTLLGKTAATGGTNAPYVVKMGGVWTGGAVSYSFVYPLTYHIHVFDYEVYMFVNYSTEFWQHCCFGQTPVSVAGTGCWVSASLPSTVTSSDGTSSNNSLRMVSGIFTQSINSSYANGRIPFMKGSSDTTSSNSFLHSNTDGQGWSIRYDSSSTTHSDDSRINPLLGLLPNTWNLEPTLLPIREYFQRASGFVSLTGELQNCYLTRNDYYQQGQVVAIGTEHWKIYPVTRKNTTSRDGSGTSYSFHSGTFALAVRYDGPV